MPNTFDPIQVWSFEDAPEDYKTIFKHYEAQAIYLIKIPKSVHEDQFASGKWTPIWIEAMGQGAIRRHRLGSGDYIYLATRE